MSKYNVAIIDNKVELLLDNGENISESYLEYKRFSKIGYFLSRTSCVISAFFFLSFLISFTGMSIFLSSHTIFLSIITVLFFISFIIFDSDYVSYYNKADLSRNELNLANIALEKEIFEAEERLKSRSISKNTEGEIDFYSKH